MVLCRKSPVLAGEVYGSPDPGTQNLGPRLPLHRRRLLGRLMNIEGSSNHSRKPIRPSSVSQAMWRSIQAASAALSAASAKAGTAEGISVSASRRTVSSNEVNQGRKVDSIRFRDEDGCRDRFWGWSKKSR